MRWSLGRSSSRIRYFSGAAQVSLRRSAADSLCFKIPLTLLTGKARTALDDCAVRALHDAPNINFPDFAAVDYFAKNVKANYFVSRLRGEQRSERSSLCQTALRPVDRCPVSDVLHGKVLV